MNLPIYFEKDNTHEGGVNFSGLVTGVELRKYLGTRLEQFYYQKPFTGDEIAPPIRTIENNLTREKFLSLIHDEGILMYDKSTGRIKEFCEYRPYFAAYWMPGERYLDDFEFFVFHDKELAWEFYQSRCTVKVRKEFCRIVENVTDRTFEVYHNSETVSITYGVDSPEGDFIRKYFSNPDSGKQSSNFDDAMSILCGSCQ